MLAHVRSVGSLPSLKQSTDRNELPVLNPPVPHCLAQFVVDGVSVTTESHVRSPLERGPEHERAKITSSFCLKGQWPVHYGAKPRAQPRAGCS